MFNFLICSEVEILGTIAFIDEKDEIDLYFKINFFRFWLKPMNWFNEERGCLKR